MQQDVIDHIVDLWEKEETDKNFSSTLIIGRILRLSQYIRKKEDEVLSQYRMDRGQFDVLAALKRIGGDYALSPKQIKKMVIVSSGALTNRISQLEKAGMLTRNLDKDDRRSIKVQLTKEGIAFVEETLDVILDLERQIIKQISASEEQEAQKILKKMLLFFDDHA